MIDEISKYLDEEGYYYIYQDKPSSHFIIIINGIFSVFVFDDFNYYHKSKIKNNGGYYFKINTLQDLKIKIEDVLIMTTESWKIINWIEGLEGVYSVSSHGRIMNNKSKTLLRPVMSNTGYLKIELGRNNYNTIHRVVAKTYIDNPENKPFVNHIDGNKTNNNVCNLEWCTNRENAQHYHNVIKKSSEKVLENKIKDYLFQKGHLYVKIHGSNFMVPGISDILACVCGRFVAFEVKAPGLKRTESEQQKVFGNNVIKSGGLYFLVDSLEEVIDVVEGIEYVEKVKNE